MSTFSFWLVSRACLAARLKRFSFLSCVRAKSGGEGFTLCKWVLWWACSLFSAMIEMTRHVHYVFTFWQWRNFFESRPLSFVYLYALAQSIQKQIVQYDKKNRYPEEHSTVDKVGRKRFLAKNSVELIASSFLILSPSKRNAFILAFLF